MAKQKDTKSKLKELKEQLNTETPNLLPVNEPVVDDIVLNNKQLRFCIEYVKDNNGSAAAKRAGYSEKTAAQIASELLTIPKIQLEIQQRQELQALASNVKKEYVQTKLIELIQDCYTDEKVDRTSILKALDMLAKLNSLYTPDTQVNIQNNVTDGEIKITIVKPEQND